MKTVVITGSSRGIGAETARVFTKNGYNVVLNYKSSGDKAKKLLNELGAGLAVCADVSTEAGCKHLILESIKAFGKIDVFVNNAGISLVKQICDTSEEDFDNIFNSNIKSCYFCSKYVSEYMIKAKKGVIINISSMWGISGSSCETAYSASKGAIISFTKALAKELAPSNIRVNCVAPGFILTDMNKQFSESDLNAIREETPLNVLGKAEDIAKSVLFLSEASFITGQVLSVDGGIIL